MRNPEAEAMTAVKKNRDRFEQAWSRYIGRLRKLDEPADDGRARHMRRWAVRAARRRLEDVCDQLGIQCPGG